MTTGEGGVRCVELSELNGELSTAHGRRVIFKREDENPTGSHKARALAYQVSYYKAKGHKTLLISSSGNAAIAAAAYCNLCGINLIAFVDKATPKAKLAEIRRSGQTVLLCTKPINFAKYASRVFNIPNLRPSTDDLSIEPYKSIAFELYEEFDRAIDAVFIFPTSASSLIGIARGFVQLKDGLGELDTVPKIIAVQTGAITSIARQFITGDDRAMGAGTGIAGALGVKSTSRAGEAVECIRRSGGGAVIVSADEIVKADSLLRRFGIATSMEGAANLAGVIKSPEYNNVVCLLTGREYHETKADAAHEGVYLNCYSDVREMIREKYDDSSP